MKFLRALWDRPVLLLVLPPLIWSTHITLSRAIAEDFPPFTLTCVRWIVAALILAPFVWEKMRQQWPIVRRHWLLIAVSGATGMLGYSALAYIALRTTQAANVAFINSILPLLVPVAAFFLARETVRPRVLAGLVVSCAGVAWIMGRGEPATLLALSFTEGDLITVAAVLCYALYSVLIRRKPPALDLMVFLLAGMLAGAALSLPFAVAEAASGRFIPATPWGVFVVLYIGLVISLAAYLLWNRCIAALGATVTGVSYHLLSVFTPLMAYAALGERLAPYHGVGIALILVGVALSSRDSPEVC
jgi:drug/metabolite transporter (DMT)-like permease